MMQQDEITTLAAGMRNVNMAAAQELGQATSLKMPFLIVGRPKVYKQRTGNFEVVLSIKRLR